MLCVQMYWMCAGHHPLAEPREAALRVLPAVDERRVAPLRAARPPPMMSQ